MSSTVLPPVAPEVLAEAVEGLSARLRKRLDAAIEACGAGAEAGSDGTVTVRFGEDAVVTLSPGPSGTVTDPAQAVCACLLAPRCLHRAAALCAAPLADPEREPYGDGEPEPESLRGTVAEPGSRPSGAGTEPGLDPAAGTSPETGAGAGPGTTTGVLPGAGSEPRPGVGGEPEARPGGAAGGAANRTAAGGAGRAAAAG
ncbi:hypothetical protein ACEPPI_33160, partial [Streptomyces sp. AB3(2024)]